MSKDLVIDRRLLKVERVIGDAKEREAIESEIALPFKIEKCLMLLQMLLMSRQRFEKEA